MMRLMTLAALVALSVNTLLGREIFVDAAAKGQGDGSKAAPFATVQEAANLAWPGDTVTIADGLYREWVKPPRGGTSDDKRITYRAAPGARPVITGSEPLTDWEEVEPGLWKCHVPDVFFARLGGFNPFLEKIHGDFFYGMGRRQLRAMLIVNDVRSPMSDESLADLRKASPKGLPLINVASLTFANGTTLPAQKVAASEGLKCTDNGLEYVYDGAWARYDGLQTWPAQKLRLRVAAESRDDTQTHGPKWLSADRGAWVEVREDGPTGRLLGVAPIGPTGGWTRWDEVELDLAATEVAPTWRNLFGATARQVTSLCLVFRRAGTGGRVRWTAEREGDGITLYARFPADPATLSIETAARPMVFYPPKTGRNYITLRGLTFRNASPNWAPPTAEQEAIVGTNWSRGWIIEDCTVYNSTCSGIALGKHGDSNDNCDGFDSQAFVHGIARTAKNRWHNVGYHVVRRCHIYNCGQTGVIGSMGCAFSRVEDCRIHDLNFAETFTGHEQSGIKFHGAVDVQILRNRIARSGGHGIWLDWMCQGTRVSGNIVVDTQRSDFFAEVDHGPILVDNNIFASATGLWLQSQGCAFLNNVILGKSWIHTTGRRTPYFKPHSVTIANMMEPIPGGDLHFIGNVLSEPLPALKTHYPSTVRDNVVVPFDAIRVRMGLEGELIVVRTPAWNNALKGKTMKTVKAEHLGKSAVAKQPYEEAPGKPWPLDKDISGTTRGDLTFPGPYADLTK